MVRGNDLSVHGLEVLGEELHPVLVRIRARVRVRVRVRFRVRVRVRGRGRGTLKRKLSPLP